MGDGFYGLRLKILANLRLSDIWIGCFSAKNGLNRLQRKGDDLF